MVRVDIAYTGDGDDSKLKDEIRGEFTRMQATLLCSKDDIEGFISTLRS